MSTRRAGGHYDATMQLYVDGELLPREAAKISTFNHRLRYGDGCSRGSASTTDVSAWTSRPGCACCALNAAASASGASHQPGIRYPVASTLRGVQVSFWREDGVPVFCR